MRENKKKLKREGRKMKQQGNHRPLKKDPGIPNLYPLKKELLEELQRKKETVERLRQIKRLQAREHARKEEFSSALSNAGAALPDTDIDPPELQHKTIDSTRKAFFKELLKVIEAADIVIEVLDARDPQGCRSRELENKVLSFGPKRLILLVNKIDLVPPEVAESWYRYLSQFHPVILFKSNTQKQCAHFSSAALPKAALGTESGQNVLSSSKTVGFDALMGLIKNYMRAGGLKTAVTIGVVGYPNVGKSSLINSLKRERAVGVSSQPGFTRTVQEVEIEAKIKVLDSPGVIFESVDKDDPKMVLRNVKKIENLEDPYTPVQGILSTVDRTQLLLIYAIPQFTDLCEFLTAIAMKRGKLKKGGVADFDAAAKIVLHDWVTGKIPYYSVPPDN